MSATTTSPAWKRPGATSSPTLRPCIVTVRSASTQAPATSPVEAFTPEGRSTATTGAPAALIASILRAASSRGSPWKPVPKSASTITSAPPTSSETSASRPAVAQDVDRDPPVAPVRAAAADGHEAPRLGEAPHRLLRDRAPRPGHQLVDVVAGLGRAHLVGRVERLKHPTTTQTACRELPRVRHREVDPPRADPLGPLERCGRRASRPASAGPAISISRHVKRTPEPSALPTASLPAKRAA